MNRSSEKVFYWNVRIWDGNRKDMPRQHKQLEDISRNNSFLTITLVNTLHVVKYPSWWVDGGGDSDSYNQFL